MKRFQHRLRVAFGDAEEGAGGAFGAAVALLPVLQRPRADADERSELALAQAQGFPDGAGVGPVKRGFAGGFLFTTQDGTALFEAGGELLEEFVFHGYSVWMMALRVLS
jgi:hypothetical protein